MALFKCPECGKMVSEHAISCPECGCVIDYILEFHRKKEREKKTKEKKQVTPIIETLSSLELGLIKRIETKLNEIGAAFYYDVRDEYAGFRRDKNQRLFFYFSRRVNGDLYVHVFRPSLGINEALLFDPKQLSEYFEAAIAAFSTPEKSIETNRTDLSSTEAKSSLDSFAVATKNELSEMCRFAIKSGRILPIEVTDVAQDKGHYKVWFQFKNGAKGSCRLSKVEDTLFESEEAARAYLFS